MRRLLACLATALLLALATAGAAAPLAGASAPVHIDDGAHVVVLDATTGLPLSSRYKTFGYRWPRGRIPYVDLTPKRYRADVLAAVRAWNASGTGVRFVAVPKRRATLKIHLGGPRAWGQCYGVVGLATTQVLGDRPVWSDVTLARSCAPEIFRLVVTHELGHVLGLDHEDGRCATMNSSVWLRCPSAPAAQPWLFRCRLLETDDMRGAAALYGGRPRRPTPAFCARFPPPAKARVFTVTPDPAGSAASALITLTTAGKKGHVAQRRVLRKKDTCPTRLDAPGSTAEELQLVGNAVLGAEPAPGTWCYAAFTVDEYGRTRGPRTVRVVHATGAGERLGLAVEESVVNGAVRRVVRFTSPGRPAFSTASVSLSAGTCAAGGGFGSLSGYIAALPAAGQPASVQVDGFIEPGPACAEATLSRTSGSVTVRRDVVLENHAPTLTVTADATTCDAYPYGGVQITVAASDVDGADPTLTVDWGDGAPVSAFAGQNLHTYTTAGPHQVTVTAVDAQGASVSQTVTATQPDCAA